MKVIVVRQPWAWLIVNGYKDIENRTWKTRYRGPLLIQASANLPPRWELDDGRAFARKRGVRVPEQLERGGIIGVVQLDDCVTRSPSRWFQGPVGWILSKPKPLSFIPSKGRLGLFDPPKSVLRRIKRP
jgi:ASCH domain